MKDAWVDLLGRDLADPQVEALLSDFAITKRPKIVRGDPTAVVKNESKGIEITFRDAAALDVGARPDQKGKPVLQSVRMYGERHDTFRRFEGKLPLGLGFDMLRPAVEAALGGEPSWENAEAKHARWDLDGFCVFVRFQADTGAVRIASVQLPVAAR